MHQNHHSKINKQQRTIFIQRVPQLADDCPEQAADNRLIFQSFQRTKSLLLPVVCQSASQCIRMALR